MIKMDKKKSDDSNPTFSCCRNRCEAMRKGTDKDWEQRAGCMTFPDAVSKVQLEDPVGPKPLGFSGDMLGFFGGIYIYV